MRRYRENCCVPMRSVCVCVPWAAPLLGQPNCMSSVNFMLNPTIIVRVAVLTSRCHHKLDNIYLQRRARILRPLWPGFTIHANKCYGPLRCNAQTETRKAKMCDVAAVHFHRKLYIIHCREIDKSLYSVVLSCPYSLAALFHLVLDTPFRKTFEFRDVCRLNVFVLCVRVCVFILG